MKKLTVTLSFCLLSFISFNQITFEKIFSNASSQVGFKVHQTLDNGFIIIANQYNGSDHTDMLIIKTNEMGDTTWTHKIFHGETYGYVGSAIEQTSDSGYIVAGTKSYGLNLPLDSSLVYLTRVSKNGEILWSKTYSHINSGDTLTFNHNTGADVKVFPDNGFIVLGRASVYGMGTGIYLFKTDESGKVEWKNRYIFPNNVLPYNICLNNDTTILIGGTFQSFTAGPNIAYMMKTTRTGDSLWLKTINAYTSLFSTQKLEQNKFLVGVKYDNWSTEEHNTQVHILNSDGEILSSKYYEIENFTGSDVYRINDNQMVIGGTLHDTSAVNIYLCKIDSNDNLKWEREYGYVDKNDRCYALDNTNDGGYIMVGYTMNPGDGIENIYLIKTDQNGGMTWFREYSLAKIISVIFSPNPFTTSTTIEYEIQKPQNAILTIYNHLGQLVYQTEENQPKGKQELIWNAENFADGIYYYRLKVGDAVANGKMVKVR